MKLLSSKWLLLFITSSFVAATASADILFIDINDSPKEIAAAKAAADTRGEKFILFPPAYSATTRRKISDQKTALLNANTKLQTLYRKRSQEGLQEQIEKAEAEYKAINKGLTELQKSRKVNAETLKEFVAANKGMKPTSLIISGHDGSGSFSGSSGDLESTDLQEIMDENPKLRDGIRSFYLWGCYTTTANQILTSWRPMMPNLSIIGGFDESGPKNTRPANHAFLQGLLEKEKDLIAEADAKKLTKQVRAINGFKDMYSSVCVGDNLISNSRVINLKKLGSSCPKITPEQKEMIQKYKCRRLGNEPECLDVPKDTHTSDLRDYYNFVQAHSHCQKLIDEYSILDSGPEIVRLIFYENILDNFVTNYSYELEEADSIMKELGATEDYFRGLAGLSRSQLAERFKKIREFLIEKGRINSDLDLTDAFTAAKLTAVETTLEAFQDLFFPPSERIPMTWVTEKTSDRIDFEGEKLARSKEFEMLAQMKTSNDIISARLGPLVLEARSYMEKDLNFGQTLSKWRNYYQRQYFEETVRLESIERETAEVKTKLDAESDPDMKFALGNEYKSYLDYIESTKQGIASSKLSTDIYRLFEKIEKGDQSAISQLQDKTFSYYENLSTGQRFPYSGGNPSAEIKKVVALEKEYISLTRKKEDAKATITANDLAKALWEHERSDLVKSIAENKNSAETSSFEGDRPIYASRAAQYEKDLANLDANKDTIIIEKTADILDIKSGYWHWPVKEYQDEQKRKADAAAKQAEEAANAATATSDAVGTAAGANATGRPANTPVGSTGR